MKYLKVKFKDDYTDTWEEYCNNSFLYKYDEDIEIRAGDYIVVETVYGLALGVVDEIIEIDNRCTIRDTNKKIVTKIEGYNLFDEINKKKRIAEIKEELLKYENKVNEQQKYNLIQTMFPETVELINELNKLNK